MSAPDQVCAPRERFHRHPFVEGILTLPVSSSAFREIRDSIVAEGIREPLKCVRDGDSLHAYFVKHPEAREEQEDLILPGKLSLHKAGAKGGKKEGPVPIQKIETSLRRLSKQFRKWDDICLADKERAKNQLATCLHQLPRDVQLTAYESLEIAIGKRIPSTWVVVDHVVLGKSFTRPLRDALATNPQLCCGIVESIEDLPDNVASTLIVSGKLDSNNSGVIERKLKSVKSLILANPAFLPAEFPTPEGADVRVAIGEFAQNASASDWAAFAKVEPLVGAGEFVPNWPDALLPTR